MKKLLFFLSVISLLFIFLIQSPASISANNFEKFSVNAIEASTENILLDGLPDGINIETVNKRVVHKLNEKILAAGMGDHGQAKKIKIKYQVDYFGHKFNGFWVRYVLKYNLQLMDMNNNILLKQNMDVYDKNIFDVIEEMADDVMKAVVDYGKNI
jgi:hypothetical protein